MKPRELITNPDGRLSTTAFVQFGGFLVLAGCLMWSVYLDRASAPDLFAWFAAYCGGLTVSKGAVTAYKATRGAGDD